MLAQRNWIHLSISLILIGLGFAFLGQKQTIGRIVLNDISNVLLGSTLIIYGIFFEWTFRLAPKFRFLPLAFFTVFIVWISLHSFKSSGYLPEQLIEHGIFIGLPLYLVYILKLHKTVNDTFLKLLIALTFTGHGIYALGVHYVPNNFIAMTTTILGLDYSSAYLFLKVAGSIDLVVAVLLFFSPSKLVIYYILFWGLTTALARLVYGFHVSENSIELLYWFGAMVFRLPHGVLVLQLLKPATKSEM